MGATLLGRNSCCARKEGQGQEHGTLRGLSTVMYTADGTSFRFACGQEACAEGRGANLGSCRWLGPRTEVDQAGPPLRCRARWSTPCSLATPPKASSPYQPHLTGKHILVHLLSLISFPIPSLCLLGILLLYFSLCTSCFQGGLGILLSLLFGPSGGVLQGDRCPSGIQRRQARVPVAITHPIWHCS